MILKKITFLIALNFWLISCSSNNNKNSISEKSSKNEISTAIFTESCCTPGEHKACQDGIWCDGEELCDCWGNCEVGPPRNCDDGDICTEDTCINDRIDPPGNYGLGHCEHRCIPGPTCLCPECRNNADCNDGNACTTDICDSNSLCMHSDLNCDDGNICTEDSCDTLTGCVHSPISGCCTLNSQCDDGIVCTRDVCDLANNVCSNTLMDGYCLIDGVCYLDGSLNPSNDCQICMAVLRNDRWLGVDAGTPCDDRQFCTTESYCDGDGNCIGSGNPCADDGLVCTDTVCDEAGDRCTYPVKPGYCLIGGVCYNNGQSNPANPCQICDTSRSNTSWSGAPAGTPCNDGLFCTATDTCNGSGSCAGTGNPCNDGIACTNDSCNEATDSCSYPVISGYCLIGGTCYTHGQNNPSNVCQYCDNNGTAPDNPTGWTNKPAGTNCDDGLFCNGTSTCNSSGTCVAGSPPCSAPATCATATCDEATDTCSYVINSGWCLIGGVCYANGTTNPANQCQSCQSAVSQTAWTNKSAGSACNDGLYCTATDTCNGSGLCVGTGNPCNDGKTCTNDNCNESTDSCSYPVISGYCLIGGTCYTHGQNNPSNVCQYCDNNGTAPDNPTGWTNRPAGTNCDDGLSCNGTSTCNASGTCVAGSPPCSAPASCTTATCDEATDTCGYTINAGWCYIGGVCYANDASNQSNVCQRCWTATSQTSWSNRPDGQYTGCTGNPTECTITKCISGTCSTVANTGASCTYTPDPCRNPGICQSNGLCGPGPSTIVSNDQCSGTIRINLDASGDGSVSGTTVCATNNYSGSCGGGSANDVVYYFTYTVPNNFQLYSHNIILDANYDSVLYARTNCTDSGSKYCNDNCVSNAILNCGSYGLGWSDSAFNIQPAPPGTVENWTLIADGTSTNRGTFTLRVDTIAHSNNPCWDAVDNQRRVDATAGGVWRGNISGYRNDIMCGSYWSNEWVGNTCDCNTESNSCGSSFAGTYYDPARAWFILNPPTERWYCIWTNEMASPNWFDTVIEVWDNTVDSLPSGCDGWVSYITCSHRTGQNGPDRANATKVQIYVPAGELYMVGVSRYCSTTPGSDYEIHFDIGTCE